MPARVRALHAPSRRIPPPHLHLMPRFQPPTGRQPGPPSWAARRHAAGFTFLELLLVLALLSVVATIGLPRLMDWVASARVENAARVVAGDLESALTAAARQGKPVRIAFDAASMEYRLVDRATGSVLHRRRLGPGTEHPVVSAVFTGVPAEVYPNRSASGAISVTIAAGEHARRVDMTSAGFIRIVDL